MANRAEAFFRWVWRANGLIVLALGCIALFAASAMIFNIGLFSARNATEKDVTKVAGADLGAENLRLGSFNRVRGTGFLYATLASPSDYIGSGSSDGLGQPRNLLFFDTATRGAHWLLPNNMQQISEYSFIGDSPEPDCDYRRSCEDASSVQAVLLEIDPLPHEMPLTKRYVAIGSADGRNLATIAYGIDRLLGHYLKSRDSLIVFYSAEGALKVLEVDPVSHTVKSDAQLSAHE